jgi:Pyridine nucleotide-disulphide oxidoreductase
MPWPGGLIRNEVQCLHDFGIPLLLEHTVKFIHGEEKMEGVTACKVDADRKPIPGTERYFPCDCLLLSAGLIPENELSLKAGVRLDAVTGGPVIDEHCQTSTPGIFAGGNVVHVHDLVDWVSREAELAGRSAAIWAGGGQPRAGKKISVVPGKNVKYVVPQEISGRENVTVFMRVTQPGLGASISVGKILQKRFRSVRPSEMITLELDAGRLREAEIGDELFVDCNLKETV